MACLRDIKKWLKLYDDKTNRLDVARCLGEANLVNGDLLPILGLWRTCEGHKKKHLTRVALACRKIVESLLSGIGRTVQLLTMHNSGIAGSFDLASGGSQSDDRQSPSTHTVPATRPSTI